MPLPKIIPHPRSATCDTCGHNKTAHNPSIGCETCHRLLDLAKRNPAARSFVVLPYVCRETFKFRLSRNEREQAAAFSNKLLYENRAPCANCHEEWMGHTGYLCPNGDSTFVPLVGGSLAAHRGGVVIGPGGET